MSSTQNEHILANCYIPAALFAALQVCDLQPAELIHVLGDAHVYANHVEPLKEQLRNPPRPFPVRLQAVKPHAPCCSIEMLNYFLGPQVLRIKTDKRDIDSFVFEDLELIGYNPHKKIAMQMAV